VRAVQAIGHVALVSFAVTIRNARRAKFAIGVNHVMVRTFVRKMAHSAMVTVYRNVVVAVVVVVVVLVLDAGKSERGRLSNHIIVFLLDVKW